MRRLHLEKRKGRFTRAASLALVVCLGLAACSGSGSAKTPKPNAKVSGTVQWWTNNLSKGFSPYLKGLISTFESEHPSITINWVDVAPTDMSQKYLAAVASGSVPDAVNFSSAELGAFRSTLSNMKSYFSAKDLAVYQPSLVKALEVGGTLYAIPWYNGGGLISYYRGPVMAKVGFSAAQPPKTFDDTLALAQKVKDVTGTYGMNISFLFTLPYYYGVPVLNANKTKAAFDTPKMVKVLNKLKKYYSGGALAPGTVAPDFHNYPQSVSNKQIAFMPANWATDIAGIEQNAPDVYKDLIVAASPTDPQGHALINGQQTYAIPKKSKNKAAAALWLKFVTDSQNQLAFCKLVAIYPSTVTTLKSTFFTKSSSGTTPTDKARTLVTASLSNLVDAGTYGTKNDIELQKIFSDAVRSVLSGSSTAEEALKSAAQQWDKILGS